MLRRLVSPHSATGQTVSYGTFYCTMYSCSCPKTQLYSLRNMTQSTSALSLTTSAALSPRPHSPISLRAPPPPLPSHKATFISSLLRKLPVQFMNVRVSLSTRQDREPSVLWSGHLTLPSHFNESSQLARNKLRTYPCKGYEHSTAAAQPTVINRGHLHSRALVPVRSVTLQTRRLR